LHIPVAMPKLPQVDTLVKEATASASGRTAEPTSEPAPEILYCIFRSGREHYCLSGLEVEEIVEWPKLSRVPLAPPFLMGIFNLRGVIVPVLDIAYRENLPASREPTHLVVAAWRGPGERDALRVGLAADEMFGTCLSSRPLLVEEAPRELHFRGMLRHGRHLALALDIRRLAEALPVSVI
jgi:chemotaxis signal transduction protein